MAHTATINRELEILTHASQEGVAREILQLASDSTATELRAALDRAQGEKRIREVRAGVFKLRAGIEPTELSKSERQALLARIRKAIAGSPPPAQAVTLARLLFNLDSDVSGRTLSAVADVAERARPDEPDAVRSLLEEVLAERAVWLQSTQHNRLALAYAGTLTAKDPPKTWAHGIRGVLPHRDRRRGPRRHAASREQSHRAIDRVRRPARSGGRTSSRDDHARRSRPGTIPHRRALGTHQDLPGRAGTSPRHVGGGDRDGTH